MIRVFLADDHTLVRQGMRRLLQDEPDIEVVGEAADSAELLSQLSQVQADVVVLDLSMPGPSGLEVLSELRKRRERPRVLVVSMHPAERFAIRALQLGAAGYLTKERAADEMVQAIRRIHQGGRYISTEVAELLAESLGEIKAPHERLSHREMAVFTRLAAGHSVTDIAQELGLSVATVYTYRARIMDKMELKSNADLTRYALEHALLD
ncbi:MAG: response regulator transcription factor [Caldilineales bacterium]|nr:response regulator transcription factor [Caldilineales bacterium]MDW8317287.1 response regulator transcription factor [Anaerolineae bacterium]